MGFNMELHLLPGVYLNFEMKRNSNYSLQFFYAFLFLLLEIRFIIYHLLLLLDFFTHKKYFYSFLFLLFDIHSLMYHLLLF